MTTTVTAEIAQAFVPGHITGIFVICDASNDPLQRGSMGAGFCIRAGTLTQVEVQYGTDDEITVEYNGIRIDGAVTKHVVRIMREVSGKQMSARITHKSHLPIGVGFGASGAGALGTALALGSILFNDRDSIQLGQYAHLAEIANHTGLGDVIAQTQGGLEIRLHPGGPGTGKIMKVPLRNDYPVVLAGSAGLETKEVLTNPKKRTRINEAGKNLLGRLREHPNLEEFAACSYAFANRTGLMTHQVHESLKDLHGSGLAMSSMVMLGNSVFCICNNSSEASLAEQIMAHYWSSSEVMTTSISLTGGVLRK